jgi:MinD-like ATPase involved in chromosome partitioning or flagellar assembly
MTTHDLIQDQPTVAFAGAQRASKYIEASAAPIERPALAATPVAEEPIVPETEPEDSVAVEVLADDVDLGTLSIAVAPRVAQRGARGMLAKLGLKVGPGPSEVAAIDIAESQRRFEDIIRQATWTRAVSILIANPKGGVGKTPTALLLGGMLAAVRGGSVCIMEVSDDPGALTFRSEGSPTRGLGELIRDAAEIRSAGQLAGYTAPQTSFAAVVGSVGPRPRLEGEDVTAVAKVIDDYFSLRVMDSGNQPSSTAFRAAIETTDVLVIPIFNAGDAALEAAGLLDTLRAAGGKSAQLADSVIVVRLHDGRPENPQVVKRVDSILASYGVKRVHTIPYDGHIAERGQLSLAKLAPATHQAVTAAAADVVAALQLNVR